MKKIIIDTNALMAISEFKIDLFRLLEEYCDFLYQVYILSGTITELQRIKETQQGKFKRAAKLALDIILAKNIPVISGEGTVDDLLVSYSKKGCIILTMDALLKKRLHKPYLAIRQKKQIILVE